MILTTPNAFHEEQTIAGFAAGKAVFCEKPLTMTGDGAKRMVEAAEKAGKVLGIGHERRYEPAFEELFADRQCRRPHRQAAEHRGERLPQPVPGARQAPIGARTRRCRRPACIPATGIHMTDMFCALAGTPVEVRAETDTLVYDKPMEDYVRAKILFKSGVHAMFSSLSCTPFYGRFTAYGETGWAEVSARPMSTGTGRRT